MSRHALILLDGSLIARQVLPFVTRMFATQAVKLSFLRVLEDISQAPASSHQIHDWAKLMKDLAEHPNPETHPVYESPVWHGFKDELTVELEPNLKQIRDAGFVVDLILRYGDPVQEIQAQITETEVDLVVMASKGHTGLSRAIFGSVAETLVKRLNRPILIVKPECALPANATEVVVA